MYTDHKKAITVAQFIVTNNGLIGVAVRTHGKTKEVLHLLHKYCG